MGCTIFFLTVQFLQPTLLHIHIHTSPQLFTSVVRILQNTSDTLLKKQKREMETVQWWNCCGNTWRCVAMCIVRDVYSGLPVEVVQWVSLTFYPFFICFLSHSGRYTLTSLNLVYEVLLFFNANTLSAPRGMATIFTFDRKCSTWCAVQYLPLQGLNSQAVLHQSLEDMKIFEFPEVQDLYQVR